MQGEPLTLFMCNRDLLSLSQAMRAMTAIVFRTKKRRLKKITVRARRLLFPGIQGSGRSSLFSWTRKRGRAYFSFRRLGRPIKRGGPPFR